MTESPGTPWPDRRCAGAVGIILALALTLSAAEARAAELRATLERNPIHVGESVHLVLELDRSAGALRPDLTPLNRDFEVLGTSANTQIKFIHGQQSATTRWNIELMAKRRGTLVIPPLAVGSSRSAPLELTVLAARSGDNVAGAEIFLEAELGPDPAYVQAQMRYVVRLLRAVDVVDGTLTEPSASNATLKRLGRDISYTTVRAGRQYRVLERRYAIFPQASGEVVIPAVEFQGEIVDPGQAGSGITRLFQRGRRVRLRSEPARATVRAPPADFPGRVWLPAKALSLGEEWSKDPEKLVAGEPVTRTLRIQAMGLGAEQLPELAASDVKGVKEYGDQPVTGTSTDSDWVRGVREQRIALVPASDGSYTLPEIRIPWWDIESDALREAVIPARTMKVAAATGTASAAAGTTPDAMIDRSSATSPWWLRTTLWQGISAGLALLWLGTLLAWRRARHSGTPARKRSAVTGPDISAHLGALRRGCLSDDAGAAREALLRLGAALWPQSPPRNLMALAERVEEPRLRGLLTELDRNLYAAPPHARWQGAALWRQTRHGLKPRTGSRTPDDDGLAPLYPRHG